MPVFNIHIYDLRDHITKEEFDLLIHYRPKRWSDEHIFDYLMIIQDTEYSTNCRINYKNNYGNTMGCYWMDRKLKKKVLDFCTNQNK